MSFVALAGNPSGTGTLTVSAPNTNSNRALTLPDASGEIALKENTIGVGQTWQNLTGSRAFGTTYTNNTGRPIQVHIAASLSGNPVITLVIGGVSMQSNGAAAATFNTSSFITAIVPPGATYSATAAVSTLVAWNELR